MAKNSVIFAHTTFKRVADVLKGHLTLTFLKKKRQNNTAFLLAFTHKQIDCDIKKKKKEMDILRAAEYTES